MITIICGAPGKGKTALMTYFARLSMIDNGSKLYLNSCRKIDALNNGGFSNLKHLPQRHTTYSDYVIKRDIPFVQSYYVDGFSIALPNPFFETTFFAPFSQIFLDEAQKYYDSRLSKYTRECVYRFYQLHRHNNLNITMTCQRLGNIDLNIRQIAERIILVDELQLTTDSYQRIVKMVWFVKEFDNLASAESFIDNGNKGVEFKKLQFTYFGNIFKMYDSFSNEPAFYDGQYNSNFNSDIETNYSLNVESFVSFNENHKYFAPLGFWKNEKRDAEILKKNKLE